MHTRTHARTYTRTGFIIHQSVHLAVQSLASPTGVNTLNLGAKALGRFVGADMAAVLPGYVSA